MEDLIIYENDDTKGLLSNKDNYVFSYILVKGHLIVRKLLTTPFKDVILFDGECENVEESYKIIESLKL